MANELPNLGADIILEFQQSINNIQMFGQAMEGLDIKFGNIERRIDSLRSSLSSMSSQVSRGTGKDLRAEMERELNNLVAGNGIVLSKVGTSAFKVEANTIRDLMQKVNSAINLKLAESFKGIVLEVDPSLNTGKIPIQKDDFDEVNRAIARLVRVQLNNLVSALQKHGAGLISAQDLSAIQFHIGRGTVQQIINRVKAHINQILLNPTLASGSTFEITDRDLSRVFRSIRDKVRESVDGAVKGIDASKQVTDLSPNVSRLYDAINDSARDYIRSVTQGVNAIGRTSMEKPVNQLSNQLKRFMANELGTDLAGFNKMFADHKFTNQDVHSAELRRQFARLEQSLNRKIGGGLAEEVKQIVRSIDAVEISYSPRLHQHLVREINRINNQIVKKIREQIDIQFAHMRAEIAGVNVAPKDINRARRIRDLGRVEYEGTTTRQESSVTTRPMANDPYARRDAHFNTFGLQGALVNTFRHIIAGSMVGAPFMLLYRSFEEYKTSQLEQLKMFSNLFSKSQADIGERAADGDFRTASEVATQTVQNIMPFVREASVAYAMDYGTMAAVASVGTRLLDDPASVKMFTDNVGKIFNIDREGDPVEGIAPGLEAFMGQFDLHVGELERRVVAPLAVATNLTNATTESVMRAVMRSGSAFKTAGVSPEEAIAMVATSIQYTGLTGENIGNFYKSILPRLQAPTSLGQLERLGVDVYEEDEQGVERVRGAMDIMRDVSELYDTLTDREARNTIMSLFGTYQSAKGATTLDELSSAVRIAEAIEGFDLENLDDLLANNLTSPIMEMERAGTSVTLAMTTLMEELTPAIVDVSRAITNLTTGIRENSDHIVNLIQVLGSALIGYGTVYGMRRLYNSNRVQSSFDRVETIDGMYGNRGVAGRGATAGSMQGLAGLSTINQTLLANTRENRTFMAKAFNDPALNPVIKDLSNMNDDRMKELKNYIQDNNIAVNSMKDLVFAAQESRGYVSKAVMTDEQRWGTSRYNVGKLYSKNMQGIDEDFANNLALELQDRERFNQISQADGGMKVTSFLAGLDDSELPKFRQHLEDIHKQTGKVVTDFEGLSEAVDSYNAVQLQNREELRRTNPQFVAMGNNIDKIANSMNGTAFKNGARNFDTFLGTIGQKARGAVSALGGLTRTVAGFGGQMLLFAGIGEFVSSMATNSSLTTESQINLKEAEKTMQDIDKFKGQFRMGFGSYFGDVMMREALGMLDWVIPGDRYTGTKEIERVAEDFGKFLETQYGADFNGYYSSQKSRRFLEREGLDIDDIFNEYATASGTQEEVSKARSEAYKEGMKRALMEEEELTAVRERMNQTIEERARQDRLSGTYNIYDLEEVRNSLQKDVGKLEAESVLEQLRLISQGYATDSEEYIKIRKEKTDEMIDLYQGELTRISDYIETSKQTLDYMIGTGDFTDQQISDQRDEVARWEQNQKDAQREFEARARQLEQDMLQATFNATMSRIGRAATLSETALAIRSAVNDSTMDRSSTDYVDASIGISRERINNLETQIEQLRSAPSTEDQRQEIEQQIAQLQAQVEQEAVGIRDLQLSRIGLYRQGMEDRLSELSNEYLQQRVNMGVGGTDESNPILRNLRVAQYGEQVEMFSTRIADFQRQLAETSDPERQLTIQREIRDLQQRSLQAQLGILDEMKNTGGTFNLPENVRAMTYYEYVTRNNSHSTYTVQGGDTHVTVSMPNITDGTSIERIRQIGQALGQGINEGRSLRLQKQANPHGYRG